MAALEPGFYFVKDKRTGDLNVARVTLEDGEDPVIQACGDELWYDDEYFLQGFDVICKIEEPNV